MEGVHLNMVNIKIYNITYESNKTKMIYNLERRAAVTREETVAL
jgi:hypothetical protein